MQRPKDQRVLHWTISSGKISSHDDDDAVREVKHAIQKHVAREIQREGIIHKEEEEEAEEENRRKKKKVVMEEEDEDEEEKEENTVVQDRSPLSKWHEELLKRSRSSSTWHPAAAGSTFACWIDPLGPSGVKTVSSFRPPITVLPDAVADPAEEDVSEKGIKQSRKGLKRSGKKNSSSSSSSSLSLSRVHTTHPVYFPSMESSRRLIEMVSVCLVFINIYISTLIGKFDWRE